MKGTRRREMEMCLADRRTEWKCDFKWGTFIRDGRKGLRSECGDGWRGSNLNFFKGAAEREREVDDGYENR